MRFYDSIECLPKVEYEGQLCYVMGKRGKSFLPSSGEKDDGAKFYFDLRRVGKAAGSRPDWFNVADTAVVGAAILGGCVDMELFI